MKGILAILVAFVIVAAAVLWRALNAMCHEEIETRIGRLPSGLIRLAALRLPPDIRSDLTSEWTAELDFIVSGTEGLPVTRLLRGLGYAASLLRVAPSVAQELTGTQRRRLMAVLGRGLTGTQRRRLMAVRVLAPVYVVGATAGVIGAVQSFNQPHQTMNGVSFAAGTLAFLLFLAVLAARDLSKRGPILVYAVGCLTAACCCFVLGPLGIALGCGFAVMGAVLLWAASLRAVGTHRAPTGPHWPPAVGAVERRGRFHGASCGSS